MNQDIKLAIDQLEQVEPALSCDIHVIEAVITMLETLGNKVIELEAMVSRANKGKKENLVECIKLNNKVAEQAAVIEKLREALQDQCPDYCEDGLIAPGMACPSCTLHNEALAIPTDSKQVLNDWMREQIGEPVAYHFRDDPACFAIPGSGYSHKYPTEALDIVSLYKLPGCLK